MSPKSDPARGFIAVTKSDTLDIKAGSRALYVGVAGDVTVRAVGSTTNVLFKNMPVGEHPIEVSRVMSTGTAATDIVALY